MPAETAIPARTPGGFEDGRSSIPLLVFGLTLVVPNDPDSGMASIDPTAELVGDGRLAALPARPAAAPGDAEGVAG